MSFELDIDPKELAATEFMNFVHRELVKAALHAKRESKLTQREAADLLGMDKAMISRILSGRGNPTVRTVGELLYAFGSCSSLPAKPADQNGCNQSFSAIEDFRKHESVGTSQPKQQVLFRNLNIGQSSNASSRSSVSFTECKHAV